MSRFAFHPDARAELLDAARYYERQRQGLGREFRLSIETTLEAIAKHPRRHAQWRGSRVRHAAVRRFPYVTYFFVTELGEVFVIAVAHSRQRPAYLPYRLH